MANPTAGGNGWATQLRLASSGAGSSADLHTAGFDDGDEDDVSMLEFIIPEIIIRRGATATFHLDLALPAGQDPASLSKRNQVVLADVHGWRSNAHTLKATTVSVSGSLLVLSVAVPDDYPAGEYTMNVKLGAGGQLALATAARVVVLFNPWCSTAVEFFPEPIGREEYVMLEDGTLSSILHSQISIPVEASVIVSKSQVVGRPSRRWLPPPRNLPLGLAQPRRQGWLELRAVRAGRPGRRPQDPRQPRRHPARGPRPAFSRRHRRHQPPRPRRHPVRQLDR
eukprot:COSAG05_NODE_3897_length_1783_cov_3.041568_2_plen_282_part_00